MKLLVAERLGAKTEEALEIAAVEEGRSPPDDFWRVAFKLDIGAYSEADTPEEDAAAASKDSRSAGWEDAPSFMRLPADVIGINANASPASEPPALSPSSNVVRSRRDV